MLKNDGSDGKIGLVSEIDSIINEHYQNSQLSLTFISEKLARNPSYLSSIYKNETGENISDKIVDLRINKAKELLDETNEKTYIIAEHIGYVDCSYFSKIFKKLVGLSPNQYRKQRLSGQ